MRNPLDFADTTLVGGFFVACLVAGFTVAIAVVVGIAYLRDWWKRK